MIFIKMISLFFILSGNLNQEAEIAELVQLVKTRLNIESVECEYWSLFWVNPEKVVEIDLNSFPIKKDFTFFYQRGNYLMSRILERSKPIKGANDKPSNLLELLVKKYYQSYQAYNSTQKGIQEDEIKLLNYYFCNEIGAYRLLSFREGQSIPDMVWINSGETENMNPDARSGNPTWLFGQIGFELDTKYNFPEYSPNKSITELLDLPGETFLRKDENYRILIHKTKNPWFKPTTLFGVEPWFSKIIDEYIKFFCFEIWIDDQDNIVQIREVDYFPLLYGKEFVKELCGYDQGLFYPYEVRRIFKFEKIKEFSGGIRIPLKGTITTVKNSIVISNELKSNISTALNDKNDKINALAYRIMSNCFSSQEDYFSVVSLEINPDTLKVNQPIPENTFIAPELTIREDEMPSIERETKDKESYKHKAIIFITGCVLFTLIAMFITRRYFGWGL